jgi:hypothetical protein
MYLDGPQPAFELCLQQSLRVLNLNRSAVLELSLNWKKIRQTALYLSMICKTTRNKINLRLKIRYRILFALAN